MPVESLMLATDRTQEQKGNLMVAVAKCFDSIEPLSTALPKSATDYYAIVTADLERIESDVHVIENALVTVDFSLPYQYTYSIALEDGTYYENLQQFNRIDPCEEMVELNETVGFIEDRFTIFNVCHFLFDKLGRTKELAAHSIDSYFLFREHPYFDDVFATLGLKQTRLPEHNNGIVTYKIKKLCISSSSFKFRHPAFNFRPEVMELLNEFKQKCLAHDTPKMDFKRVFVDRNTIGARNVVNKDEFYSVLEEFEFECVPFENYTLFEQAKIVNGASLMLGIHGAGLSNAMFFGDPNFKLLEIFPPLCASSDYWKLSNAFGIDYDAFIADDLERERPDYSNWPHDPSLNRRDIHVNIDTFRQFLRTNIDS